MEECVEGYKIIVLREMLTAFITYSRLLFEFMEIKKKL